MGSYILLNLSQTNEKVRAIFRDSSSFDAVGKVFSYGRSEEEAKELFSKIEWVPATLNDIPALTNAFTGITKVYHCAALVSFNSAKASLLRKTNIEGTANIVNLCVANKIQKLVYISSIATMDLSLGEKYVTEDFTWHPEKDHTEYAISKHGAEIEVWRGSQEGVPVIVLNPGVILGAGFWDKGSGQIFKRVDDGLNYHFPKTTGFVGVKDVAAAAIIAMNSIIQNEQYIVVEGNYSFRDILTEVAESISKTAPKKELKPWMVYIGWIFQSISSLFGGEKMINKGDHRALYEHTYYSSEKIRKELNFQFTPMNKVIRETGELFRKEKKNSSN